jgi:hypothetical protein
MQVVGGGMVDGDEAGDEVRKVEDGVKGSMPRFYI